MDALKEVNEFLRRYGLIALENHCPGRNANGALLQYWRYSIYNLSKKPKEVRLQFLAMDINSIYGKIRSIEESQRRISEAKASFR